MNSTAAARSSSYPLKCPIVRLPVEASVRLLGFAFAAAINSPSVAYGPLAHAMIAMGIHDTSVTGARFLMESRAALNTDSD